MKYKYILESVRHFCIKRGLNELGYIRKQNVKESNAKKALELGHKQRVITMFRYKIANLSNMLNFFCTSNTAGIERRI